MVLVASNTENQDELRCVYGATNIVRVYDGHALRVDIYVHLCALYKTMCNNPMVQQSHGATIPWCNNPIIPHSVQGALPHILKQLQLSPYDDTTEAAADVLRAACQGNEASKAAVRKDWGIPLLVLLIGPTVPKGLVERAVDCLRILTTNNDENRGALIECNSALPYLLSLMEDDAAAEVWWCFGCGVTKAPALCIYHVHIHVATMWGNNKMAAQ